MSGGSDNCSRGHEGVNVSLEGVRRLLLDESPDRIFAMGQGGTYLYVNKIFASSFKKTVKQMIGKKIWHFFPKEEADQRFAIIKTVFQTGEEKMHDGCTFPDSDRIFSVTITPIKNPQGQICMAIGTAKDVTERKIAEMALKQVEARISAFMEFAPALILIKDHDLRPVFANSHYKRLFPFEAWQGKLPHEIFDPVLADQITAVDLEVLEKGSMTFEESWKGLDGTEHCFRTTKFRIDIADGAPMLGAIIIDITEQKRVEEEREKLQSQLLHAQKLESVGRLAGGVAHDFNNMLQAIQGFTELAMMQVKPSQPLFKELEQIKKTARRSADLTRQLLAFARKQPVAPKDLDINETVGNALTMLRRLIGENIELAWLPGAHLGMVRMDPSQVDQVLANLCVNARDAIQGAGRITIETANASFEEGQVAEGSEFRPGDYVVISLGDTGAGIEPEVLEHLFEPFFTTKELGKGTGLGLATVYGIVKQNDGFIQVNSEVGRGTTFKIHLPCLAGLDPLEKDFRWGTEATGGSETILVVEDESSILEMCRKMLEQLGYRVLVAGSPLAALDIAAAQGGGIDLLLTDVILPEMNGRELSKRILQFSPNLKYLFMSGYSNDVIANHGVLEPGVHYLQKPFSMIELAVRVREALEED